MKKIFVKDRNIRQKKKYISIKINLLLTKFFHREVYNDTCNKTLFFWTKAKVASNVFICVVAIAISLGNVLYLWQMTHKKKIIRFVSAKYFRSRSSLLDELEKYRRDEVSGTFASICLFSPLLCPQSASPINSGASVKMIPLRSRYHFLVSLDRS